jgi:DNA replication protein DnaC
MQPETTTETEAESPQHQTNTRTLTAEEQEWLQWREANRICNEKRAQRRAQEDAEPLSAYADRILQRMVADSARNTEKFFVAEKNREIVLSHYISRVKGDITKSTLIPAYCNFNGSVNDLAPLNEKIAQAFDVVAKGGNVFLSGGVGVGKTYAAKQAIYRWCLDNFRYGITTDIADEAHERTKPQPSILNFYEYDQTRGLKMDFPRFVNAKNFLAELRETFNTVGNESEVMKRYLAPPLLVFDDLGAEKTSDWTRDRVLFLLETRLYDRKKQTVITSNLSISEIASVIDDRLSSRIVETCACFRLEGEDLRLRRSV